MILLVSTNAAVASYISPRRIYVVACCVGGCVVFLCAIAIMGFCIQGLTVISSVADISSFYLAVLVLDIALASILIGWVIVAYRWTISEHMNTVILTMLD